MGMVTARYNRGNNANSTTQSKAATAGRTVTREMTLRWRCGTCLSARKRERVSGVLLSATVRVGFSVENDSRRGGNWAAIGLFGPDGLGCCLVLFFCTETFSFFHLIFCFEIQSNNSNIQINQTSTTLCIEFSSV